MDVIIFHCHVWLPEVSICGSKVCGWPWVHGHHRVLLWCSEKNMSFKTIGTTVAMESRVTSYRDPPKKNQATSSYRVMAIYFPSFCWGRHTSTNKNNTVTLELGACSSEIYPLCKIWKTHQSIIFPGKSWAPHGFSIGFPIYVGKSSQVFSFSHGKSRHIMPYP